MITSDVASLIIGIEENVQPESAYYGKPVEWREKSDRGTSKLKSLCSMEYRHRLPKKISNI
jgi:hypothetical protein